MFNNIIKRIAKEVIVQTVINETRTPSKAKESLKVVNGFLNSTVGVIDYLLLGTVKVISGTLHGVVDVITLIDPNESKATIEIKIDDKNKIL